MLKRWAEAGHLPDALFLFNAADDAMCQMISSPEDIKRDIQDRRKRLKYQDVRVTIGGQTYRSHVDTEIEPPSSGAKTICKVEAHRVCMAVVGGGSLVPSSPPAQVHQRQMPAVADYPIMRVVPQYRYLSHVTNGSGRGAMMGSVMCLCPCQVPVFSIAKRWLGRTRDYDLLVPLLHRAELPATNRTDFPWEHKIPRAFFRGRTYCHYWWGAGWGCTWAVTFLGIRERGELTGSRGAKWRCERRWWVAVVRIGTVVTHSHDEMLCCGNHLAPSYGCA